MHTRHATTLLAAALAGVALLSAGCSDQNAPQTVSQRVDRPVDKMAATDVATVQAARPSSSPLSSFMLPLYGSDHPEGVVAAADQE